MLWPLSGVVQRERLDEVIVDGRAVRASHFATVIAVEVQSLVRHHHGLLAAVALRTKRGEGKEKKNRMSENAARRVENLNKQTFAYRERVVSCVTEQRSCNDGCKEFARFSGAGRPVSVPRQTDDGARLKRFRYL